MAGCTQRALEAGAHAEVAGVSQDPDTRIACLGDECRRTVDGGVVDDDDLVARSKLGKDRLQLGPDEAGAVVGRHGHRNGQARDRRGSRPCGCCHGGPGRRFA
jgi:hypothetical protein